MDKLKNDKEIYLEEKKVYDTREMKALLKKQNQGIESSNKASSLRAKMLEREMNRKRLYSDNPEKMVLSIWDLSLHYLKFTFK